MKEMIEEEYLYFPLQKSVWRQLKWGEVILTLLFTFGIIMICTDPKVSLISGIFITISSIPLFFLFIFFFIMWIPIHHEAIITNSGIVEKKYWRKRRISWKDINRIVENPIDPLLLGSRSLMGNLFFFIQSSRKTIRFTDHIEQYEKFKEIVLDRAGSKDFKYNKYRSHKGVAQEWIKETKY